MKITCGHEAAVYGVPVILDDTGAVMDYGPGVKLFRVKKQISTQQLAEACGVSRRTVEGWEQNRKPPAAALNVMAGGHWTFKKKGGRWTFKKKQRAA